MKPIACPYCGGRIVNGADVDLQIFPAVLDDVGGWREGEWGEGVGTNYEATCFFCHTCQSEFMPPAGATGTFDDSLSGSSVLVVPEEDQQNIRKRVFWIGIEEDLVEQLLVMTKDWTRFVDFRARLEAAYSTTRSGMIDDLKRIVTDTE